MQDHNIGPQAHAAAPLIDIGINLGHDSYDADREAVIARANAAGVVQLMITGASLAGSARAIELAHARATLFATAGVHPHHASELTPERLGELTELARDPRVVAVGECGLDYFRDFSPRAAQQAAFHRQLELARDAGQAGVPAPARCARGLCGDPARARQQLARRRALLHRRAARA